MAQRVHFWQMWYTTLMHKSFYASGFLYSLKTHKILLLQSEQKDDIKSLWSILGGEVKEGEDAINTFQRVVYELLNIDLKIKHIYPIYDYFHDKLDRINYVFYAEVKSPKILKSLKDSIYSWVSFSETVKLPFASHTKQDVIVGERVINAKWRDDQAIETSL